MTTFRIGDVYYVNKSVKGTIIGFDEIDRCILEFRNGRVWTNPWGKESLATQEFIENIHDLPEELFSV